MRTKYCTTHKIDLVGEQNYYKIVIVYSYISNMSNKIIPLIILFILNMSSIKCQVILQEKSYETYKKVKGAKQVIIYAEQYILNKDTTVTIQTVNKETGVVISSRNTKGTEPKGINYRKHKHQKDTLDYNFELSYFDTIDCGSMWEIIGKDILDTVFNKFEDELVKQIVQHLFYPEYAMEEGLSGKVHLAIKLDTKGNVQSISIHRPSLPCFDKEAARVIRKIDFKEILPKEYWNTCLKLPLSFVLKEE